MDVPADILQILKCSSCEAYLSRGPIYVQHNEVAVCGRCVSPTRPATRILQYEAVAKILRFPCRNEDLGCLVKVPFVDEHEVIDHEEVCEYRQYVCPILGSDNCDWIGTRSEIHQHCSFDHPDNTLQNSCILTHNIIRSSTHTYLLRAFQVLFLLYTKVCLSSGKIFYSVRHLGSSQEAASFEYTLDIKRGEVCISKLGVVAPQGCLAIQEPTSLAVGTNSLLEMLGGFSNTTFTVTLKRRITDEEQASRRMSDEVVEQARQTAPIPGLFPCENQGEGCTHQDTKIKCWKHNYYFCEQGTKCGICGKPVSQGSLPDHYVSAHRAVTYEAGSTWRVTNTSGRRCLVSIDAGYVVCWSKLTHSQIVIRVFIPVTSEELNEFFCVVGLTQCSTGQTRTYEPEICYSQQYDWSIVIRREEFPSWSGEFDVSLHIWRAGTN